jgi:hypothetical protein
LSLQLFVCAYDLDKQQTIQNTKHKTQKYKTNTHTYILMYPIVVWKSDVLRGSLLFQ